MVRRRKKTQDLPRARSENRPHSLDHDLRAIFSGLAIPLLRDGHSYKELIHVAKRSIVDSAAEIVEENNQRPTTANIAALTGLTRIEISRIRKEAAKKKDLPSTLQNRGKNVAIGWSSDKSFLDKNGRPRALQMSGGRQSFSHLVKKYGGDVPTRAMLKEMIRPKLVRQAEKRVYLLRTAPLISKGTRYTIQAMAPWISLLAKATPPQKDLSISSTVLQRKIHFSSMPEVLSAVRELNARQQSFISAIEHLGTQSSKSGALEITISLALATTAPPRPNKTKRRRRGTRHVP